MDEASVKGTEKSLGVLPAPADRHFFLANAYGATFWDCLRGNMCPTLAQYAKPRCQRFAF
jgi:hypothetical protein